MNPDQIHQHLSIAYKSCRKGLTISQPARSWLASQDIDVDVVPAGLSRGHFHKGNKKSEVAAFIELGLLHSVDKIGRYRSFGKDHLLFPLFDKEGHMINWYALSMEKKVKHAQL